MAVTDQMYREYVKMKKDQALTSRGARIPGPVFSCGACDAGWLWHEDNGHVVVMSCDCQR